MGGEDELIGIKPLSSQCVSESLSILRPKGVGVVIGQ